MTPLFPRFPEHPGKDHLKSAPCLKVLLGKSECGMFKGQRTQEGFDWDPNENILFSMFWLLRCLHQLFPTAF